MTSRTFKDRTLAACYRVAREHAADNFSTFYYGKGDVGPRWPHRGAGHRNAYWNGRLGARCTFIPNSPAYAYWAAGVDDRREAMKRGGGTPARTHYGLPATVGAR